MRASTQTAARARASMAAARGASKTDATAASHRRRLLGPVPSQSTMRNAMNWDQIEGNWKQFKGHIKQQWGKLTDDQLDVIAGKREQLSGKIQESYGVSKDEAEKQLDAWQGRQK